MNLKEPVRWLIANIIACAPKNILADHKFFDLYQSKGWHVMPIHFYHPIPDTSELPDSLWDNTTSMVGINVNIDAQSEFLSNISDSGYLDEYHSFPEAAPSENGVYSRSGGFGNMDGAILYGTIRKFKPKKIIEIGSGQSTLLSLEALTKNETENAHGLLTAIEPYPKAYLENALQGVGELIVEKVQNVQLEIFETLSENDVLFIDSSHVVKINSDVIYEINEILPRLKKGVIVHIHDIFMPYEYPKSWIKDKHAFWTEQYFIQAFLAFNSVFEISYSAGLMRKYMPEQLANYFPYFDRNEQQAGSLWIRRIN